jgi:hypothetical protein
MTCEFVHNNPRDLAEERIERLEAQVSNISNNMNLLTTSIEINLRPFEYDGGYNSEIVSEGKSRY